MEQQIFIGVAGELAAGKDTVTKYILENYSAYQARYSKVLEDILDRLYLSRERKNYADVAEGLRSSLDRDILSQVVVKDGERSGARIVIADGIRKPEELHYLKSQVQARFIFVDADIRVRYERVTQRNEKADDAGKTFEQFVKEHEHPADNSIELLKAEADFILSNDTTVEALQAQVKEVLTKIGV